MKFKKLLLSLAFVVVFGIYVLYERSNSNNVNPIIVDNNKSTAANSLPQSQSVVQNTPRNTTPAPTPKPVPAPAPVQTSGRYKNGQYIGSSADAFYGLVQVQAVISGGRLTNINFLNYPQDNRNSLSRSQYALPQLKSEAIQAQSANVNGISGATETSRAFVQSLSSALSQAS